MSKGHYTKEERAERVKWIVRLYQDHSIAEISRITGSCVRFVSKILCEQGIKEKRPNPYKGQNLTIESQKRKALILSMVSQGLLYKDIASQLGVTLAYVSLVARENGVILSDVEMSRRKRIGSQKLIESEKRRLRFGLEQKTNLVFNINPNKNKIYDLRVRMRKHGYVLGELLSEVYFDENTQRSERCENTAKKYHIKVADIKQCLKCV